MSADQTLATPAATAMPIVQFADPVLRRGLSVVIWLMAAAVAGIATLAFWTSFEAILDFATHHGEQDYGWRVPLLVDTFVLVATLADLWCSATRTGLESKWQRVVLWWPKLLLAAAVIASFAFNVGHAKPDLGNRAVAAMPPVALVVSFELLMFITRRAIAARVARLAGATTTSDTTILAQAVRIEGDQATTLPMVAATSDRPALPPTMPVERATSDRQAPATRRKATSAQVRGATYRRVRELYEGGMTVAAQIARELGVSASYAQRTLRQVKADLAREATTRADARATTDQPADQATGDHQAATRSQDEQATTTERASQATIPERSDQATTTDRGDDATTRATTNGDGRTTSNGDRHLSLVRDHEADHGEVPSR